MDNIITNLSAQGITLSLTPDGKINARGPLTESIRQTIHNNRNGITTELTNAADNHATGAPRRHYRNLSHAGKCPTCQTMRPVEWQRLDPGNPHSLALCCADCQKPVDPYSCRDIQPTDTQTRESQTCT